MIDDRRGRVATDRGHHVGGRRMGIRKCARGGESRRLPPSVAGLGGRACHDSAASGVDGRIARVVARLIGDQGRAEDLAVEAFWRLWRNPHAHGDAHGGWVYRTAVRLALDELRRRARRARYEGMLTI